jgi:hypothetical protein
MRWLVCNFDAFIPLKSLWVLICVFLWRAAHYTAANGAWATMSANRGSRPDPNLCDGRNGTVLSMPSEWHLSTISASKAAVPLSARAGNVAYDR